MDAYVRWFESDGEKGQRALAMLRLMGLFDRPADSRCLGTLWKRPAIAGLTEPLILLSEAQRKIVLTRLSDAKLLTVNRDASRVLLSLDAHPLLREYSPKTCAKPAPARGKLRIVGFTSTSSTRRTSQRRRSTIYSRFIKPSRTAAKRGCMRRRVRTSIATASCAARGRTDSTAPRNSAPSAPTSPSPVLRAAVAACVA